MKFSADPGIRNHYVYEHRGVAVESQYLTGYSHMIVGIEYQKFTIYLHIYLRPLGRLLVIVAV